MKYLDILNKNLKQSAQKLSLRSNSIFQQDNDLKYTAEIVKLWLLYNCKMQSPTPPQSPDLKGIENLWYEFETSVQKHNIRNKEYLKTATRRMGKITPEITQTLVHSAPCRLEAVLKAKGYAAKY
ncbi:hypothetical protein AVEN_141603-1 [Araneus ventricosus]|uniref:Tc1-like transposase DDE domain-containing protein n=1 Tax=Araneus ventricosus TaxID=182803 RepID=A0A4Y2INE9_ARAVE|nr:hypothetical protein AVEN_141603-1 [Araneus ventricosus]